MNQRTSKIVRLSSLIAATIATAVLAAGVVAAEPARDGARTKDTPTAKSKRKAGADGRQAHQGRRGARVFKRFDANHDGRLQQAEVPAKVWKRISVADANGDKVVTKAELKQARAAGKLRPHRRGQRGKQRRS